MIDARSRSFIMVVGTRPNLVKAAPVYDALSEMPGVVVKIAHTGQHYDPNMDSDVAGSLGLPSPDWQGNTFETGYDAARAWLKGIFSAEQPDAVIVIGDVNSTYHAALAAKEAGCLLVHVESGLRSGDLTMPEERNRIAVDAISDLLLASEPSGVENLRLENVPGVVELVGSCTVDALVRQIERAPKCDILDIMQVAAGGYILCTIHRQATVDDPVRLAAVVELLKAAAVHTGLRVVWPIHPRTLSKLDEYGIEIPEAQFQTSKPVDYTRFTTLMQNAGLVLTDSGGIQEETSYLGIRCITLRDTTERPVTIDRGTNDLLPSFDTARLVELLNTPKPGSTIDFWDGLAARRSAKAIMEYLETVNR